MKLRKKTVYNSLNNFFTPSNDRIPSSKIQTLSKKLNFKALKKAKKKYSKKNKKYFPQQKINPFNPIKKSLTSYLKETQSYFTPIKSNQLSITNKKVISESIKFKTLISLKQRYNPEKKQILKLDLLDFEKKKKTFLKKSNLKKPFSFSRNDEYRFTTCESERNLISENVETKTREETDRLEKESLEEVKEVQGVEFCVDMLKKYNSNQEKVKSFFKKKSNFLMLEKILKYVSKQGDVDLVKNCIELIIFTKKLLMMKSCDTLLKSLCYEKNSCMKLKIKFNVFSKYLPFSSYFLPKDTIVVTKKGNKFRADFSLNSFKKSKDWYRKNSIIYNENLKILKHKEKKSKNFFPEISEKDKKKIAYELVRSSIFRSETRYKVLDFSIKETRKYKKINKKKCEKIIFEIKVKKEKSIIDQTSSSSRDNQEKKIFVKKIEMWCNRADTGSSKAVVAFLKILSSQVPILKDFKEIFEEILAEDCFGFPYKIIIPLKKTFFCSFKVTEKCKFKEEFFKNEIFEVPR